MATSTPTRRHRSLEPTPFIPSSSPTERSSSVSPARSGKQSACTYTFTPRRIKSLPRAWERRPLTPHVPRNDVQKIWKRVPLGEVMANVGHGWRKDVGGGNVNGRAVKRLKVTLQEADKENVARYLPSKWEDGAGVNSPKRKAVHAACGFVAVNAAAAVQGEGDGHFLEETAEGVDVDHGVSDVMNVELVNDVSEHIEMAGVDASVRSQQEEGDEEQQREEGNGLSHDVLDSLDSPTPSEESDEQERTATLNPERSSVEKSMANSIHSEEIPGPMQQTLECQAGLLSNTLQTANQAPPLSTDHDDTAFLHDFLSRARAQKAAKQQEAMSQDQAAIPMDIANANATGSNDIISSNVPTTSHVGNAQEPVPTTSNTWDETPVLRADQDTEPSVVSPRRSSRLTTRLPRPQKPITTVPSNIALKRLNGTEFIATQRETQSLAMTTRANTKRNKADAVNVQLKLIQLAAEQKAQAGQVRPLHFPKKDGAERKKRKNTKVVSWDNTIARFEDGEEVLNSSLDEPGSDAETQGDQKPLVANENTDGIGGAEDEKNETGGNPEENKENDEIHREEQKQVRKVRRLRKLNVGNVNGTPAPKRRASLGIPVPTTAASSLLSSVMGDSTEREMAGFLEEAAKQTIVPVGREQGAHAKPRILRRRT
ncbi:hypothetical protein PV08_06463 [Exophiala spinifera]|uniref:Uncharacterized protein n=1 Tax=Exophiala spinifera TaxID=91928 RepID=A0A0D1YMY9_9EURO|nr:uncharacterized protein PV08_06463 [Exophiala spinifera]KIW16411.1 hypothetical protein PV08_06463 [Exophiala spinifera]